MTTPSIIRIFFAVDLPVEVKEDLGKFIADLKRKSRTRSIRWTKADNLHITLQFLAEFQLEHIDQLLHQVRQALSDMKAIKISIGKLHLFPNPYLPRVIVLDIAAQEALAEFSAAIGKGIQQLNYEIESRPFRAHLTLGRIKHTRDIHLEFLDKIELPTFHDIAVNDIALFRSDPQPDGSRYTVLDRITLG